MPQKSPRSCQDETSRPDESAPAETTLPGTPYLRFIAELLSRTLQTIVAKNHDYAGPGNDPLWNFQNAARLTNTSVPTVLISRMGDKLSRLANATRTGTAVPETIQDTLTDLIGYCGLLAYTVARDDQGEGS